MREEEERIHQQLREKAVPYSSFRINNMNLNKREKKQLGNSCKNLWNRNNVKKMNAEGLTRKKINKDALKKRTKQVNKDGRK